MISIVSPIYRAENIIYKLVDEIEKVMVEINQEYEIILVDDRSPDNSWEEMMKISKQNTKIKSIRLSRNFGQHPAIMAGLSQAKGDWIVVMDCDLQDQPKEIKKLYNEAQKGFDVVMARRVNRQDSFFKKITSRLFSIVYSFFTDTKYNNEIANFGIYKKNVIQAVISLNERIKFFPLFVNFVGFNQTSIIVNHAERYSGSSTYNLSKLLSLAFNNIISFSNKPLKLMVNFGSIISLLAIIFGVYNIYLYVIKKISVPGYSSIIISIWFLSGLIITSIGIIGIYIGKIFNQTKDRPVFIINEIIN